MKKIIFFALFFYFLALVQTSFLVHFDIVGTIPNLILIFLVLALFFEKSSDKSGYWVAALAGFYLDVFSGLQLGVSIFVLILLTYFVKRIVRTLREENVLYFVPILILAVIFYGVFSVLLNSLLSLSLPCFSISWLKLLEIAYNLLIGVIAFYLIKCFGKILGK